jgi:hypothetical protein
VGFPDPLSGTLNAAAISGGQNVNSLIFISLTLGERLADHQAQVI